ncbi:MAG: spondin domain-containing protein [Pseudomonadota bacterium]
MTIRAKVLQVFMFLTIATMAASPALASNNDRQTTYKITIYNLTAGQPLTPPVVAVHNSRANVFSVGNEASDAVVAIAENGDLSLLTAALAGNNNVNDYVVGDAPIVPAHDPAGTGFAASASFKIKANRRARFVSFVSMLICTNDGFTGIDTVSLPHRKKTIYANAYETRSEYNTEDFADIVPPCQGLIGVSSDDGGTGMSNPALAEDGVVIPHAGVVGDNDLESRVHNWADPVVKIVIERLRH